MERNFQLYGSTCFFEKASAPEGQRRRIAGVISTETRDRQQEILIQKGLDFQPFLVHGWFNDNHSKATDGIVGFPEMVKQFKKGETLPDGRVAHANSTWAEGYLLEGHPRADSLWQLGQALQKAGGDRGLGFSIEGTVQKRMGPGRKIVAMASVQNCAITNAPVNTDTRMECLAKALKSAEDEGETPEDGELSTEEKDDDTKTDIALTAKALTAGTDSSPAATQGPKRGEGAGAILTPESLESDERDLSFGKRKNKKLSKAQAIEWLRDRLPTWREDQLERLVEAANALERRDLL